VRYQTHRGLQGRALGGFSTGGSLYGFATHPEAVPSNVEHPRKLWQINEAEAAIVRRIFAMVDEGKSYRAIADQLNRESVPAPRNNGRGGKHGGGWSHVSVRAILGNEKYIGRWTWNTTKWTRIPGKRARRRLRRPESEHVTRDMPELAIVDREIWDRIQARMTRRTRGDERTTRQGQRTYLTSGLLRCGVCGGPLSVRSAKAKGGVRYVNFGCTAHSSRGGSICSNASTISEKKITEALIGALHEVLSGPEVQEAFARAFARRVGERTKADKPADLERQLAAAQRRVANATRLLVDDPDDLDLRRQREMDRAEVRRLEVELAERGTTTPLALPDMESIKGAMAGFLDSLSEASERGREALARCMSPLTLTPKTNGPGRFEASGTIDLATVVANGSSGGRI
jgi:site-specific DNA recombinase